MNRIHFEGFDIGGSLEFEIVHELVVADLVFLTGDDRPGIVHHG